MADNKPSTRSIPVELLLSSIGQQVKVDLEAHRQRLLADIEERRQKLAELRRRRQELLDRETGRAEEPEMVEEPLPAGNFLDAAAPLTDDSDEDWLVDPLGDDAAGISGWDGAGGSASLLADDPDGEDIPGDDDTAGLSGWDGAGVSASLLADDPDGEMADLWSVPPVVSTDSGPGEPGRLGDEGNRPVSLPYRPVTLSPTEPDPDELPGFDDLMSEASGLLGDDLEV